MPNLDRYGNAIIPYSRSCFDEGYYMRGERGGFNGLLWDDPKQQEQLEHKRFSLSRFDPYSSVLFVGCARGLEVRKMIESGKVAKGVDVSEWAIDNADPQAQPYVALYDGWNITYSDNSFDVVAAFDVLALVPTAEAHREFVCAEMARVARKGICIRSIIKDYRHLDDAYDGLDGASFCYSTLEQLDRFFTQSGKFKLDRMEMSGNYETVFWFNRC